MSQSRGSSDSHLASPSAPDTQLFRNIIWALIGWPNPCERTLPLFKRAIDVPTHPRRIEVPSPDQNSPYTPTTCYGIIALNDEVERNPGKKAEIPVVDTTPQGVETPTPLADLRFIVGRGLRSQRIKCKAGRLQGKRIAKFVAGKKQTSTSYYVGAKKSVLPTTPLLSVRQYGPGDGLLVAGVPLALL